MTGEPERLGKYQLVGVIGKGAMGVVHRAYDPVLNRTVAVKVMSGVIANDEQLRERFLREARAAGSLQHPNVITIYDFGEVDDSLFIAMEYVDGYDLSEVLEKHMPIAIEAKLDILIDTLRGLDYAHSRGVVHRDIKPGNIRINTDGRAKLMDFGIAHMQESDLTRSGDMIGTPAYMAPEQIQAGPITPATDIFSLGCVAYELFSNTKAFGGATLHAVLFEIVSGTPRSLAGLAPSLPPGLAPVIEKALAKEPAQRYASAAEMAEALTKIRKSYRPSATGSLVTREIQRVTAEIPVTRPSGSGATVLLRAEPRRWPRLVGGAVGVVAVGAILWSAFGGPAGGAADPPSPQAATDPATSSAAASLTQVPSPNVKFPTIPATEPPQKAATPAPSASPTSAPPAAATARAPDRSVAALRTAALQARDAASGSGATAADLASGELAFREGEQYASRGRTSDAIMRFSDASQLWSSAERSARDRARDTKVTVAEPLSRPAAPPAETIPAPRPAPTPPPAAPTVTAPAVVVDERPAIAAVISAYEVAIESGDIGRIRAAYPGLTAQQQSSWVAFYRTARRFRATLAITRLDAAEDGALADVSALYEYDNASTGRAERHELKLVATLRKESTGWKITDIR